MQLIPKSAEQPVNSVQVAAVHLSAKGRICSAGAPGIPPWGHTGPMHEWEVQEGERFLCKWQAAQY